MNYWWLLPVTFCSSLLLTWALRHYALAASLMDVPNERSSHTVPTPRGGGVAIVLSFLLVMPLLIFLGSFPWHAFIALAGSGAAVALLGFLDDHGHVAARWRLLGHFVAAAWILFWLGGMPAVVAFGFALDLGWLGHGLAAVYLVWLLNLYNFMDGIDGIASVEAICFGLGGAFFAYWLGDTAVLSALLLLVAAVAGFLIWNFPPAKIFMGDAGSGFLGITIGGISLIAAWSQKPLLWSLLILLGVFFVDATVTLLRRLLRGEKVYEAHRSHAYQYASRKAGKHLSVTLAVAAINCFWLFPLAFWVCVGGLDGAVGLLIAYLPLVGLALWFNAGQRERSDMAESVST